MDDTGAQAIAGTSPMAELTREFAWDKNPLGPVSSWPAALTGAINTALASPVSTILMIGPDLITLYNDAYLPTLAERHPWALGMRGNVLWADAWSSVGHQVEAVLREGTSYRFENVLIPIQRNGVDINAYFTYSFSPVRGAEAGSILGVMCMAQDVTEAQQATLDNLDSQKKLAAVAGELGQLLGATTDAVVHVNRRWEMTYLNPAAIRTFSSGRDLRGKNVWAEFPDAYFEGSPYVEAYENAMYRNQGSTFEAFYPEPLNIWLRIQVAPTRDGIVTFARDITEEKRIASVLLQTEKLAAVGRLASTIAHEINNPLEAVTNLVYLARGAKSRVELENFLDTADEELRRVSAIASQTLRFHKQSTRPRAVSGRELFESVLAMYRPRISNCNIRVESSCSDDAVVAAYEGDIRQVLNNLIGNAIDAMPSGGRLAVRSSVTTDQATHRSGVRMTVADTGSGIAPASLSRIFEAFYTTEGVGGTGLGLWVSRDIVARHEGRLRVRSSQSAMRHGTVFTLFLPFDGPASRSAV